MRLRHLFIAAAFSAAPLFGAAAEPQILGLVAQNEAVPLPCLGGECSAEFSSFCMEPDRSSPLHETAYTPTEDAELTLVAVAADGSETRLRAAGLATFVNLRGFAAVRVSVPETALAELGATSIALEVGPRVSLLPDPSPAYKRPHEPEEIALTTGLRRELGEKIVDRGGARIEAAHLIGRLINALPAWDRVDAGLSDGLWRQSIEAPGLSDSGGRSVKIARRAYEICRAQDPEETHFTFRQCLEGRHDKLIWSLNSEYWISVAGS